MHPFRFGIQCRGPADGDGWRALARKVEDLGWSTLTIADHFDDALAPIPGLMAAADATTTLRVGTLVLANGYRHPVVVAKEAATLGGGGPRVLRLAGREADVVALNVNLKAGVIDERAFPDGTPASTDRKVAWVREAAGARVDELELQVRVHLAMVTDDRRERWGISYLGMSADQLDAFAPVIARLAGT